MDPSVPILNGGTSTAISSNSTRKPYNHQNHAPISTTGRKAKSTYYKFPILKTEMIVQCLTELGITNITKEEIDEPSLVHCKEKIKAIFLTLLTYCTGKDESHFKPSADVMKYISAKYETYNDLFHTAESFIEYHFFKAIVQMMKRCNYYEFTWMDLYSPISTRLKVQLSAIINLVKYFESEQIQIFTELNGPRSEFIQALQEVEAEHEGLKENLILVEQQAKQKQLQTEQMIQVCEELEIEIARNNRLQVLTRQEAANIKKQCNELNDQVQTAQWALQEIQAEEVQLRTKIVTTSPSRIKSQLVQCQQQLQSEKEECIQLDESVRSCKVKYANSLKIYQDFTSCIKDIDEMKDGIHKYTTIVQQLDHVQQKVDETNKGTIQLNDQISDIERDIVRYDEKIKSQKNQYQIQLNALQDNMECAKKELLQNEKERYELIQRMEQSQIRFNQLQALLQNEQSNFNQQIQSMIQSYQQMETNYLQKHHKYMNTLLLASSSSSLSNQCNNNDNNTNTNNNNNTNRMNNTTTTINATGMDDTTTTTNDDNENAFVEKNQKKILTTKNHDNNMKFEIYDDDNNNNNNNNNNTGD